MKKTNQNDLDFEMINLDETAGWNQLEIESALADDKNTEESFVFQGEITISEEELLSMGMAADVMQEVEYFDEEDDFTETEFFASEEYLEEETLATPKKKSVKSGKGKKAKKKKKQTVWDKITAAVKEMTVLDGVIAATGVVVLVVAIATVSVFSSAKAAEEQIAAFAPIGVEMESLTDAGRGTLLAMADSDRWIEAVETEEETVDFEYEEKDLEETMTVNVNMKLTSVQKDLKIKFVNYKTGKLVGNVPFEISVTDSAGTTKEYKDDDMDGIIYLKDVVPGKASVTMLALSGEKGLAFNTAPQTITIKDKIEYTKIDVAEEVKTESEVNAAVEDTAQQTVTEAELKDTVEWVASSKTEVDSEVSYEKVDKSTIADPSETAKAFVRMTEDIQPLATEEGTTTETETTTDEEDDSEEDDDGEKDSDADDDSDSDNDEEDDSSDSDGDDSDKDESETETTTPEEEEDDEDEDSPKNDKVSLLKDKSGNQMYIKNSDGKYVEAKYADYYNDKVKFYKQVKASKYKYTGWQDIDGKTYFFTKDGDKVTGEQVIQGAKYTFDSDGVLQTGSGVLGIDVSKWNGNIDWNAVKNSGISYVIIRCGYRGSTTGAMIEDPKFKTNIQGALNAGLKVGIYFFSQAVNEVEAVEEASMTIGLIKKYKISYPVFLDVEPSGGRADGIDRNTRTQVIKAYCETIRNSGYTAGVYANKTWLESYMNAGELSKYKIWLAQYNTAPTYGGKYDMWQYSSKGSVAGISGHTDMNLSYMGY